MRLALFTPLPLGRRKGLNALLDGLESDELFGPTHWGDNERARNNYVRAEMVDTISAYKPGYFVPGLARRKGVKYVGYFDADAGPVQSLHIDFRHELSEHLEQIFALGTALFRRLKPLFGFVHPVWSGRGQEYNVAGRLNGKEFRKYGPRSMCPRTWLGPPLIEAIGRERLAACGVVVADTRWGGAEVDLLPGPWRHDIGPLDNVRTRVMTALAPAGVFGDYSRSLHYKPGPNWTEIPRTKS